jgi:hypothetical protein
MTNQINKNINKMKALYILSLILVIMLKLSPLTYSQDSKKELNPKSSKAAQQEARKYIKEGYYVAPGSLALDMQLEYAWKMQSEIDEKGNPKYFVAPGNSVAESQTAAKLQAMETAKLDLAGQISTQVSALISSTISNQQLNNEDAASVTKTVAESKSLIGQKLGRVNIFLEMYRRVGKNIECDLWIGYSQESAIEEAKEILRKKLEESSKLSREQLDELLKFKE